MLEGLISHVNALSVHELVCFLSADIRIALKGQLWWVHVLIIPTYHLVLLKDYLLMWMTMHGVWRKHNTWLPNDTDSGLYLPTFLTHHYLLV